MRHKRQESSTYNKLYKEPSKTKPIIMVLSERVPIKHGQHKKNIKTSFIKENEITPKSTQTKIKQSTGRA